MPAPRRGIFDCRANGKYYFAATSRRSVSAPLQFRRYLAVARYDSLDGVGVLVLFVRCCGGAGSGPGMTGVGARVANSRQRVLVYLYLALLRFYQQGWFKTLFKYFILLFCITITQIFLLMGMFLNALGSTQ